MKILEEGKMLRKRVLMRAMMLLTRMLGGMMLGRRKIPRRIRVSRNKRWLTGCG